MLSAIAISIWLVRIDSALQLVVARSAQASQDAATKPAPLTLLQVRRLLSIEAPDATVAREVATRGTAFPADKQTLVVLKSLGAGPRTLKALAELHERMASTAVSGTPTVAVRPLPLPPVRVGGSVKAPAKVKDVRPVYPAVAQSNRIQGSVVIEVVLDVDGLVRNTKVEHSVPELDEAALNAVRRWQFTKTVVDGSPREVIMTITVDFTLR